MKNIKINYRQHWNEDGTHYTQTLYIKKDFIKYINKLIKHYHNSSSEVQETTAQTIGFSKYYDCYLKEINTTGAAYFLNLTQLQFLYYYLSINNYNVKKIKLRNTMVIMEA